MPDPTPSTNFNLVVISPDEVIYEGKVKQVIAPGYYQDLALLPDHTPMYAQLKAGQIEITADTGQTKTLPVESGIARIKNNQATIIIGF